MRTSPRHRARKAALTAAAGAVALVAAAWIIEGGGFAFSVALVLFGAIALLFPLVVIYHEERDLPRDHRPAAR